MTYIHYEVLEWMCLKSMIQSDISNSFMFVYQQIFFGHHA